MKRYYLVDLMTAPSRMEEVSPDREPQEDHYVKYADAQAQLHQSAERERVLLEALESCNNRNLEACPSCGYGTGDPHAKDCKLAAALAQSASKETDNV